MASRPVIDLVREEVRHVPGTVAADDVLEHADPSTFVRVDDAPAYVDPMARTDVVGDGREFVEDMIVRSAELVNDRTPAHPVDPSTFVHATAPAPVPTVDDRVVVLATLATAKRKRTLRGARVERNELGDRLYPPASPRRKKS